MLKKTIPTLIIAAPAAFGVTRAANAQKNYTDGGDLYGGSHATKKVLPNSGAAKSGKFDPYTDGRRQSTRFNLNASDKRFDPHSEGAKSGQFDPYTDGAKAGKFDPYTDGAKASSGKAQ
ncbi:hypothetical protein SAMN05216345_11767 [Cupriavidus sp. YR651]|uniref:hypothetical protein n=1 Tax=Cupriavidus sp. YR651 TaxID=1855315 RepID=UPI000886C7F6|nr:hypothetical protein [Cupriavidus sp. YR651]SDD82627.1 hypothetical protein SAMN05216345_11767 [Cupriavidus sp. YR651]